MTLYLLLDPYRLSDEPAEAPNDPQQIPALRSRIEEHLAYPTGRTLTLRLTPGFFRRFADFEGMPGVVVRRLDPAKRLEELLGCPPPAWLRLADWQAALCQRAQGSERMDEDPTRRILAWLDPALVAPADVETWFGALVGLVSPFSAWLALEPVQAAMASGVSEWLDAQGVAELCGFLGRSTDLAVTAHLVRGEVWWEVLRNLAETAGDTILSRGGLPPRQLSADLLKALTLAPPPDTRDLQQVWQQVGDPILNLIHQGTLPARVLATLARAPWPAWWTWLDKHLTPDLASPELRDQTASYSLPIAQALTSRIEAWLRCATCPPWPAVSDASAVLAWCDAYLPYARDRLTSGLEPDPVVAESFARWVLEQPARIQRSGHDWREAAKTLEETLANPEHLVIVIMMDALGLLDADLLLTALQESLPDLDSIPCQTLFAPLPTLTEVGKMAVLTGQTTAERPADRETALRRRYRLEKPAALCLIKGFSPHPQQALTADTRLCVYFNDQVDDSLHQDDSYASHRERIRGVVSHLAQQVTLLRAHAIQLGRRPVIFITADHGATAVAALRPLDGVTGRGNGRALVMSRPYSLPAGHVFLTADQARSQTGYLVPLGRSRPDGDCLTHGGLTPEEVLIPWISVRDPEADDENLPVVRLQIAECRALTRGWLIQGSVENTGAVVLEQVRIEAQAPFRGDSHSLITLPAGGASHFTLTLESTLEQASRVQVSFEIRYRSPGATPRILALSTPISLPRHLVQRTEAAQQFDDMFN